MMIWLHSLTIPLSVSSISGSGGFSSPSTLVLLARPQFHDDASEGLPRAPPGTADPP